MKRIILMLLSLLTAAALTSCGSSQVNPPEDTGTASRAAEKEDSAVISCRVAQRTDDMLLLYTDTDERLFYLSLDEVDISGASKDDVRGGCEIAVTYSGLISETYPSGLSGACKIEIIDDIAPDICGFFFDVTNKLWQESSLTEGLGIMSLDFREQLSPGQNAALRQMLINKYGPELNIRFGDFRQLSEEGLVNAEELYFTNGAIVSVVTDSDIAAGGNIAFSCSVWCSGTGAIYFSDCSAEYEGYSWSISYNGFAIS